MPSLDAVGIICADLAKSVRFYGLLGLQFPETREDHIEAVAANGMRVMLDKLDLIKQIDGEWIPPVGHRQGLAFKCASPGEVDDTFAKITGAGFKAKTKPFDAFWGQRYATVFDPDDNAVDLFAELDPS